MEMVSANIIGYLFLTHLDSQRVSLSLNKIVRIADFGVSGWLCHLGRERENTRTFVGTPAWYDELFWMLFFIVLFSHTLLNACVLYTQDGPRGYGANPWL